jgi:hypothetical protein
VLHALSISFLYFSFYLAKNKSYGAHRYAVFCSLLSVQSSSDQIFSSTHYPQTPSVHAPPIIIVTKLHTHTKPQKKYSSVGSNFDIFGQHTRRQKVLDMSTGFLHTTQREEDSKKATVREPLWSLITHVTIARSATSRGTRCQELLNSPPKRLLHLDYVRGRRTDGHGKQITGKRI